jgi:hypothetical protein
LIVDREELATTRKSGSGAVVSTMSLVPSMCAVIPGRCDNANPADPAVQDERRLPTRTPMPTSVPFVTIDTIEALL